MCSSRYVEEPSVENGSVYRREITLHKEVTCSVLDEGWPLLVLGHGSTVKESSDVPNVRYL